MRNPVSLSELSTQLKLIWLVALTSTATAAIADAKLVLAMTPVVFNSHSVSSGSVALDPKAVNPLPTVGAALPVAPIAP